MRRRKLELRLRGEAPNRSLGSIVLVAHSRALLRVCSSSFRLERKILSGEMTALAIPSPLFTSSPIQQNNGGRGDVTQSARLSAVTTFPDAARTNNNRREIVEKREGRKRRKKNENDKRRQDVLVKPSVLQVRLDGLSILAVCGAAEQQMKFANSCTELTLHVLCYYLVYSTNEEGGDSLSLSFGYCRPYCCCRETTSQLPRR